MFAEFKEIRKEWKARKKREENARKAEGERAPQAAQAQQPDDQTSDGQRVQGQVYQQNGARPSLPSIDHQAPDSHAQARTTPNYPMVNKARSTNSDSISHCYHEGRTMADQVSSPLAGCYQSSSPYFDGQFGFSTRSGHA